MIARLLAAISVVFLVALPAAAKVPAPVIAVIDVDQVMRDSSAAKGIREQLEKQEAAFRTEIAAQENTLRAADQELAQKKVILAPEAFQVQVQDFQKRVATLGELVQKRKRQLDDAFGQAQKQLRDALSDIVQQQMKEQGVTLVLPKAVALEVNKDLDITQETLKRLNQKLPQVKVVVSTN